MVDACTTLKTYIKPVSKQVEQTDEATCAIHLLYIQHLSSEHPKLKDKTLCTHC